MKKLYPEIYGIRYPKDPIMIKYNENICLDQYKDLQIFHKEALGEHLLFPIIAYNKITTYNPIQRIDLRFQIDFSTPKKRHFEKHDRNPTNTNLDVGLLRH